MTKSIIQRFTEALHHIDQAGKTDKMIELFADDCEISNVAIKSLHGKKGVEQFWKDYFAIFKKVKTDFTRMYEIDGKGFLEWKSEGELRSGRSITYEGLTLLEWDGDGIHRLKAFHDSAVFLKEGGKHADIRSISTSKVMEGGPKRDTSTPGEGVLTSSLKDRDAATG